MKNENEFSVRTEQGGPGTLKITLSGRLDAATTGRAWRMAEEALRSSPDHVVVDASGLEYADISGIGLLIKLRLRQQDHGTLEIEGLRSELRQLLAVFDIEKLGKPGERPLSTNFTEQTGRAVYGAWQNIRELISFIGELFLTLWRAGRRPGSLHWKDVFGTAEKAGVNALPIVALISFLVGLIMAYQSALPMRRFGAEIYVADLVGLSMVRELGPLMTAIILAGRSGSAFAAELGTMKINEEIDALITLGLEPVPFLVASRLIAAVFMTPLLTVFADLFGVAGGSVVLMSFGYPFIAYFGEVVGALNYADFLGGLVKSLAFGVIVAGIGCLRGLQTGKGAGAVGVSTTRAVVSAIVLIVAADGIFAVVYHYLGI